MLELSGVLSSDSVTRNFTRFTAGALFRGLAKLWATGIPSLVSHDSHRPTGWTVPTAVSLQPGLTRLHGVMSYPEDEEERERLNAIYQLHLRRRVQAETSPHIEALRRLLGEHLRGDEQPLDCGAAALVAPDLARRAARDIFDLGDKDGLVPVERLRRVRAGIYQHGPLVLFAHPSMRRSMSRWNSLNAPLLDELHKLAGKPKVSVRLRLDPDAVGIATSAHDTVELEYWYGPKFNNDLTAIPRGITRHEANDRERYFHGVSRTEFWWQSRDQQHILEAEELRDAPTLGSGAGRYSCRYVHSIVDETTGRIIHLDGAVRDYSEEELLSRMEQSLAEAGRQTRYTKSWRTDGDIPLSRWKLLVHHHFRDNPLVSEYFDAAAMADKEHAHGGAESATIRSAVASRIDRLIPVVMHAGDSVRILLSLHPAPDEPLAAARVVLPLEDLVSEGTGVLAVDADIHEIEKLLRRAGESLTIPDGVLRLAFEDCYHTFPLIQHDDPQGVAATVTAFEQLLSSWTRDGHDRVAAFSLSVVSGGRELRIAILGHISDLNKHTNRLRELFACKDDEAIGRWVDETAESLTVSMPAGDSRSPPRDSNIDHLMTSYRTFRISRTAIPSDHMVVTMFNEHPRWTLSVPADDRELLAAIGDGQLHAAFVWIIKESECTRCGRQYFACPCSKYMDADVSQDCTNAEIAYPFWTDRPA